MNVPRILMCPPDHYSIEYEINAWMNRHRPADHRTSITQWNYLVETLKKAGATIELLPPQSGLPDLVFTANAGLIHHNRMILSRFRPHERRDEQPHVHQWFKQHGFSVTLLPDGLFFEGAGDALFCGDTLFAGYRMRSDARSHQIIGNMLACRVIPLELSDPYYYHLDTCFCPLADGVAMYFPGAFDDYGRRALQEAIPYLIEIPEIEARRFAANAVVVNQTVITNAGCPQLQRLLAQAGFVTRSSNLTEFVKAGGSAKCLTLRLDGEEAASWKQHPPAANIAVQPS